MFKEIGFYLFAFQVKVEGIFVKVFPYLTAIAVILCVLGAAGAIQFDESGSSISRQLFAVAFVFTVAGLRWLVLKRDEERRDRHDERILRWRGRSE